MLDGSLNLCIKITVEAGYIVQTIYSGLTFDVWVIKVVAPFVARCSVFAVLEDLPIGHVCNLGWMQQLCNKKDKIV